MSIIIVTTNSFKWMSHIKGWPSQEAARVASLSFPESFCFLFQACLSTSLVTRGTPLHQEIPLQCITLQTIALCMCIKHVVNAPASKPQITPSSNTKVFDWCSGEQPCANVVDHLQLNIIKARQITSSQQLGPFMNQPNILIQQSANPNCSSQTLKTLTMANNGKEWWLSDSVANPFHLVPLQNSPGKLPGVSLSSLKCLICLTLSALRNLLSYNIKPIWWHDNCMNDPK